MTVSRVSLKTIRKTGTEKTSTAMVTREGECGDQARFKRYQSVVDAI